MICNTLSCPAVSQMSNLIISLSTVIDFEKDEALEKRYMIAHSHIGVKNQTC